MNQNIYNKKIRIDVKETLRDNFDPDSIIRGELYTASCVENSFNFLQLF